MTDTPLVQARSAEWWTGDGAKRWLANTARAPDPTRTGFAVRAMQAAAVKPGESVIEIGSGTGETAVELAEQVGPGGRVLAVDISEVIGERARERLAEFPNASVSIGDASTFAFEPESADLLFSRFGVMFFTDPVAAFANMRKALKPTGRIAFVCWRAPEPDTVLEIVYRHIPRPPPGAPIEPGPQSLSDPGRLLGILAGAGFTAPTLEGMEGMRDIARGRGVEGALEATLEGGPIGRVLQGHSAEARAAVAEALRPYFASVEADGAVMQPAAVWIVTADRG